MKSTNTYVWNGHSITINATASAKYLWLNYKFDVYVDGKESYKSSNFSWLKSSTRFKVNHQGNNTYGQVVSTGFPFTPVITQSTIMDDSIIGRSFMWVKSRAVTYIIVAAGVIAFILN